MFAVGTAFIIEATGMFQMSTGIVWDAAMVTSALDDDSDAVSIIL
jgi:hypothetical protein